MHTLWAASFAGMGPQPLVARFVSVRPTLKCADAAAAIQLQSCLSNITLHPQKYFALPETGH